MKTFLLIYALFLSSITHSSPNCWWSVKFLGEGEILTRGYGPGDMKTSLWWRERCLWRSK